jgi:hypothetical protein
MRITPISKPSGKPTSNASIPDSWAKKRARMIEMYNWQPKTLEEVVNLDGKVNAEYIFNQVNKGK